MSAFHPLLEVPTFKFAIATRVRELCPTTLADKAVTAQDFLPKRTREKDTGFDVRCANPNGVILEPFRYFRMPLGIRMFAPPGWWVELRPRSSSFMSDHIHSLYGVIDETYENELTFAGIYIPNEGDMRPTGIIRRIPFGKRVAQLVPVYRRDMIVEEVTDEQYAQDCKDRGDERGTGGYGSSGSA